MSEDMIELFNDLQGELKLTRVELSNLSSLTDSQKNDGKDYLSIMYENLSVLDTMASDRGTIVEEVPVEQVVIPVESTEDQE